MNPAIRPLSILPEVLIVGAFPFPDGSAAANNLRGHARALATAGFSIGLLPDQGSGQPDDRLPDGSFCCQGNRYWTLQKHRPVAGARGILRSHLALNDQRITWLQQHGLGGVKAVLAYPGVTGTTSWLWRLRRLCRSHGVPLINFVVEWHDPRHCRKKRFLLDVLDGELQRRFLNSRLDGLICITEYLASYYRRSGGRPFLFPPLIDLEDAKWAALASSRKVGPSRSLRLLFSGSFRRERHDLMLRAIKEVRGRGLRVVLEYLGSTRQEIEVINGVGRDLLDTLGDGVRFHGRVSTAEVGAIIAAASFGIIFRDDARWSRACFPSKVPEFLALGVPLLCNRSSDLHRYLQDGRETIFVEATTEGALTRAIERAANLDENQFRAMSAAAKHSARQFDGAAFAGNYFQMVQALQSKTMGDASMGGSDSHQTSQRLDKQKLGPRAHLCAEETAR